MLSIFCFSTEFKSNNYIAALSYTDNIHYVNLCNWCGMKELGEGSGVWASHFGVKNGGLFPFGDGGCIDMLVLKGF